MLSAPIFLKAETKISLGLERLDRILKYFGDPQFKFESCVITGTVGKGQITTNIAYNLSRFGKIALYTSPHLERFSERIKLVENQIETEISDDEISDLSNVVFSAEKKLDLELTYFEHATAMAFLWFAQRKVDFASLEVGMGGRLDAVSTAKAKIGIIGRVHFDHTDFLGKTLYDIAYEKALCVPPSSTRITLHKEGEEQFDAIKSVSTGRIINEFSYKERTLEEDFIFRRKEIEIFKEGYMEEPIFVDFFGPDVFVENSVISSFASYLILKEFFGKNQRFFDFDVRRVKGRLERRGNFIYDGGHNPISAEFLLRTIPYRITFVVAFMKDKDWKTFLSILKPKINYLYITEIKSERACRSEEIKSFCNEIGISSEIVPLDKVPELLSGRREMICFTGTFYLYNVFKDTVRLAGF